MNLIVFKFAFIGFAFVVCVMNKLWTSKLFEVKYDRIFDLEDFREDLQKLKRAWVNFVCLSVPLKEVQMSLNFSAP